MKEIEKMAVLDQQTKRMQTQLPSNQRIKDCLATNYSISADMLTQLPLGADIHAAVYRAQTKDHSYFVKLKRSCTHQLGISILKLLEKAGIQQIIPPINTTQGGITQQINDFTLIVYPFIEGQDGFGRCLTEKQWITLGKALKQVHEFHLPRDVREQFRQETFSSKWREVVKSLYIHIESEKTRDAVASNFVKFMKDSEPLILQLVDQAEKIGQQIQNQSPQFVLCHSDIHAGNVFIDKNDVLYIVDWDDPILAPKERDLMFIGGGVGSVWNNSNEEKLFYQGYGKTEVDTTVLAYYRLERIVEDIAEYSNELLFTESGDKTKSKMYDHFLAMFEPNGVVDIAFKTAERMDRSLVKGDS